jgi:8-oxo-dGTP pyrophosphatase MutT (NUDIX family)
MPIDNWKHIERRELLKTRLFTLVNERSICPRNGKESDFFIFDFGDWVNVVALTDQRNLIMIRQFRHGNKRVELEVPGGLMDPTDANPIEAAKRELFEETGYVGEHAEIIGSVYPNPAIQNNLCHTVLILDAKKSKEPKLEDGEDIETFLVPETEMENLLRSGQIKHSLVLNALLFYLHYKEKHKRK